jgi:hypothetical protein
MISVVGEGDSRITVSLLKSYIRFYNVFLNSDAASGEITNSSSERVADSLFAFEKYSAAALAVPPSYSRINKITL